MNFCVVYRCIRKIPRASIPRRTLAGGHKRVNECVVYRCIRKIPHLSSSQAHPPPPRPPKNACYADQNPMVPRSMRRGRRGFGCRAARFTRREHTHTPPGVEPHTQARGALRAPGARLLWLFFWGGGGFKLSDCHYWGCSRSHLQLSPPVARYKPSVGEAT